MKYCANCGTQLADDARFCHNCGHQVEMVAQPQPQPQPQPQYQQVQYQPPQYQQAPQPQYRQPVINNTIQVPQIPDNYKPVSAWVFEA
ncbi:MAG: zinc ribbon domain-containing protein [Bacteroidales bacterium]|nr:zinc ribbon domain-containing protein [Bacteroidales bacterium]